MNRLTKNLLCVATGLLAVSARPAGAFDLNAAIASAKPGDTIRVPAGNYDGPVAVNKSLKLLAEPGVVIDGHGRGNVVTITAPDVTFRGFTVRGSGDELENDQAGVFASAAPRVTLEDNTLEDVLFGLCVHQSPGSTVRGNHITGKLNLEQARRGDAIRVWYSPDCLVEANDVRAARDVVIWFSGNVRILNNHVTASRYGLHFMFCDDNTLSGNRLEENSVGCYLMNSRNLKLLGNILANNRGPSGYGIGLKDVDGVDAQDNRIVGNRIGIYIDTSPQSPGVYDYFTRNMIAYNDVGVAMLPSVERNEFRDNSFVENQEQVGVLGSGRLRNNAFSTGGRGNFWSDYKGFDLDGDGIGDVAYQSQSVFENLMDREPKMRLFLYSPAQQALELAAAACPTVKPQPRLSDDAPLMRPVALNLPVEAAGFAWPPAGAGAGLIFAAGLVAYRAYRGGRTLPTTRQSPTAAPSTPSRAPDSAVLDVQGLTKRFGRYTAVDDLSFTLGRGEALALWGTNGAGKTTAIRCILGLTGSRGRVVVADRDLRRSGKALRGMIGYVSQESGFQGDLTVVEALKFYARIKGAALGRVAELLADVGLADHGSKRVANLSGGMRKRLALAAALLNDPPLLVLDEIAANLDAAARHSFMALLCRLKRQGKTILFTSHRADEVETLADRVLVLERGRLLHDCPPSQLSERLGLQVDVKLLIGQPHIETAMSILRGEGFSARRNGRGIWVRVEAGRKAAPIHLLAGRQIVVENFEVETQDAEQNHEYLN